MRMSVLYFTYINTNTFLGQNVSTLFEMQTLTG